MRLPAIILSAFISLSANADTKALWETMPDSIIACPKNEVMNIEDTTDILSVKVSSTFYIQATEISPASTSAERKYAVVKTFSAPAKESSLTVYSSNWQKEYHQTFSLEDIVGAETSKQLAIYFSPQLISAEFITEDTLKICIADFMLSDEEKKEIAAIINKQTTDTPTNEKPEYCQPTATLHWDGSRFTKE